MTFRLTRRSRTLLIAALAVLGALVVLLGAFPASWFEEEAEGLLSRQIGRAVTIGAMTREERFSFSPVIVLTDIQVPQAPWAGGGKLAVIGSLRVRISTLGLLLGRAKPQLLSMADANLYLARGEDRRVNWRSEADSGGDGVALALSDLETLDATVHYRDAYQQRNFEVALRLDRRSGLTARGTGDVAGNPIAISASGGSPDSGPWPFQLAMTGDALDLQIDGTMAAPFDLEKMDFRAKVRSEDLKLVDRIIEAGLFGTQPVNLNLDVERAGGTWTIKALSGTIGSSDIAGRATIVKDGTNTNLDASIRSRRLDFEDMASDEGNAAARRLEQAQGLRVVPNTRINIAKVGLTKGRIAIRADRLVSARRPSALTSLSGVLELDGKLLVARPLTLGLTRGRISGVVTVDQREGRAKPFVTLALRLQDSSIAELFGGDGKISAPIDARIDLTGTGDTIREAVGNSNGRIGVIAGEGTLPDKLAAVLGFDLGRAILAGEAKQASLRCAAIVLGVRGGTGSASTLLIDTNRSQLSGKGTIRFPEEALALTFTGATKGGSILRVPGSVRAGGTVREPQLLVPRSVSSLGNVLKGLGRKVTGRSGPAATDADCGSLRQRALAPT